ncbi:MAG: pantoate--beta-alanine ligase [Proteobacteria bacterium]|jgi:pantoate--beta-alanine ligase|nr:pantoate--beta-alanine ligase [Pseudomonadota bacterium]
MRIVDSVAGYISDRPAGDIGFVPTMGALHKGHESLIARSVAESELTVASIYVNPTQFNNPDDLAAYPDTLVEDKARLESLGVDVLLLPTYSQIYPDGYRYQVEETQFSHELCGAHRAGHFTGVLTVVMKLLNIVRPRRAYFGEKDYQQYRLISDMVETFFLDVEIVPCPIVRESDGLALSSRNLNLDACSREKAPLIHQLISSELDNDEIAGRLKDSGFEVDYILSRDGRRFAAATIGRNPPVRLIDNVPLAGAGEIK